MLEFRVRVIELELRSRLGPGSETSGVRKG